MNPINSATQASRIRPDDLVICDHKLLRVAHIDYLGGRCRLVFHGTAASVEIYSGECVTRVTFSA